MKYLLRRRTAGASVRPEVRLKTIVWAIVLLWVPVQRMHPVVEAGEKPAIDRLFPPGGQRGTSVEVTLSGKIGDGPLQVWSESGQVTIADKENTAAEKADQLTLTIPEEATPGVHWLRFYNPSGASPLKPFVVGVLPEIAEKEPNNRIGEATALESSSAVVNGVLEKNGDVDVFSVSLKQGQTLLAAVQAHRVLGSPMDAVMQVLDHRGTILAHNDDDHGNDPLIALTIPQDGLYYVRIFAFPEAPNSSIQFAGAATYIYRLTITTEPVVSHTTPLAVNAGTSSEVQLHGWNIPAEQASVTITAPEPDVALSPLLVDGFLALPFSIDVVSHPTLSEAAVETSKADLAVPFSITGRIDQPRQRDAFWFVGSKGQKLRCQAIARAKYSMLDPVLSVYAEDGKQLKEADDISRDNPDALLDVSLPSDGRFRIEVRDRFDHAGDRFFYRLQCEEVAPNVALTVKENAFVLPADKPLEVQVTIDRKDEFVLPLEFRIDGLPPDVTLEPVRSEKDGDSAKAVTLKISGSAVDGFSGPIRIEAFHESTETSFRQFVENALNTPGSSTTWLWLTIPASVVTEAE